MRRSLVLAAVLSLTLTCGALWLAAQGNSPPAGSPTPFPSATSTPTPTSVEELPPQAHALLPTPTPTPLVLNSPSPTPSSAPPAGDAGNNAVSGATPLHFPLILAPAPTVTPGPVNPPAGGDWRAVLAYYRAVARLPALAENPAWSTGAFNHARYLVENDVNTATEDAALAFYSSEGAATGPHSLWMVRGEANWNDVQTFDNWMRWPFHALSIIDPSLTAYGYGRYSEPGADPGPFHTGAVLDVGRGLGQSSGVYPVKWPDHNTAVYLTSYEGGEQPDPLTSCSGLGLNGPAGLPILLQLGPGNAIGPETPRPVITASSFKAGATALDHCVFDETSYQNSIAGQRDQGRALLAARDAIVLIPRAPLLPGQSYTVSITALGQTHTWTFRVVTKP